MKKTFTALTWVRVEFEQHPDVFMVRGDMLTVNTNGNDFQLTQKDTAHLYDLVQSGKLATSGESAPEVVRVETGDKPFEPFHF